jgi:hypothetical protein
MRPSHAAAFFVAVLLPPHLASQMVVKSLVPAAGQTSAPSLSPDGKTLVFQWCKPDYTCGLYTRPMAGGEPRLLVDGHDTTVPSDPQWSPDGKSIAYARFASHFDNRLFARDLATGHETAFGEICAAATNSSWTPSPAMQERTQAPRTAESPCSLPTPVSESLSSPRAAMPPPFPPTAACSPTPTAPFSFC